MTVKLANNFIVNARGLTFKDTTSVTWALNASTNELSATTGGGTVGSVGLSDGSTTPVYAITGSPVTGSGTLTFTLKTQSANLVFAGPSSGVAAQPTFRSLVAADIPTLASSKISGLATVATSGAYSDLSGTPSIPVGANPSAKVGLTAVNGSSTDWMRSDGAPALDQSISPTWTGNHTFSPASGTAGLFNALTTSDGVAISRSDAGTAYAAYDVRVVRTTTAKNTVTKAPNVILEDYTNGTYASMQQADGQLEFWIYNGSAWAQVFGVTGVPTTGTKSASMSASNKPGTNNQTTPVAWLPIVYGGGTSGYVPVYAA